MKRSRFSEEQIIGISKEQSMRKILILSFVAMAFSLSGGYVIGASKTPLTKAEIVQAFEGTKMKVKPLKETWSADWTLHGKKMKVVANRSQHETLSVKWEGNSMCLGNAPRKWTAKGCFEVYAEGKIYVLWKNGRPYAKLTP